MPYLPVDTAVVVEVGPLIDDTDFKSLEEAIAYDESNMDVDLLKKSATSLTKTDITLTSGGISDWTHKGSGVYEVEITQAQNDTEGSLRLVGLCDGVLPFESPVYTVVPQVVYNALVAGSDKLEVDVTQVGGTAVPETSGKFHVLDGSGNAVAPSGEYDTEMARITANVATESKQDTIDGIVDNILTDTGTTLDALIKDIPTVAEFEARTIVSADYTVVGDLGTAQSGDSFAIVNGAHGLVSIQDDIDTILIDTETTLPATLATIAAYIDTEVGAIKAKTDNLPTDPADASVIAGLLATIAAYIDTEVGAIKAKTDNIPASPAPASEYDTEMARITADVATEAKQDLHMGSGFVTGDDSNEALRDRGDTAWITGGGGGIADILNIQVLIPNDIDLANTATVRIGLGLTNMLDDLPSTGEITPGTITIDRKAIGGTSWSNLVNADACSELAGLIYYDEVFDVGTGYAEGDSIRITFKSQKIIVAANDYEITGSDGWIFQTSIRQTMVGTDGAAPSSEYDTEMARITANVATEAKQDTIDTVVDNVKAKTDNLPTDPADASVIAGLLAAIAAYIDTEVGAIKAKTDNIPASPAPASEYDTEMARITANVATEAKQDIIDTAVDSILEDTGTTLPATLATIAAYLDTEIQAILDDTNELQGDWTDGGRLDLILDSAAAGAGGDATQAKQNTIITHLTDVKGATFAGATDSLEAIRNRGDSAWVTGGTGGGSETWVFTLTESGSGEPVADASVWVTADEAGEGEVIASGYTDNFGKITFYLDAGTYYFWAEKAGWNFTNPYTQVVS